MGQEDIISKFTLFMQFRGRNSVSIFTMYDSQIKRFNAISILVLQVVIMEEEFI